MALILAGLAPWLKRASNELRLRLTLGDGAARSADQLVEGVHVGGGIPEFHHLAVAQMEDVRFVDLDAPAAPAGRENHQRDAVLIVGEECMKVSVEGSRVTSMSLPKNPKTAFRPRYSPDS